LWKFWIRLNRRARVRDAIEAAEDDVLLGTPAESLQQSIVETLAQWSNNHPRSVDLAARMDRLELAADNLLIHADEQSQDVYFVKQGRLAIFAPNRRSGNDRIRSIGPGSIIGKMAYLTQSGRVAEVRAELASVVYRLKAEDIDKMRRDDPDLSALVAFVLGQTV
jgi:sulfate permease, SulP family